MNDKMKGGIYGLLVADALATPYEFRSPEYMQNLLNIEMIPPHNHQRTYKEAKVGSWSDEGAMMLCMLNTLTISHGFRADVYMKQLLAYRTQGLFAVNHTVFGCSRQFEQVMKAYQEGTKVYECANVNPKCRDASALSRGLPLAIYLTQNNADAKEFIKYAHAQTLLTHQQLVVGICSAIYMQWARNIYMQVKNPFVRALHTLLELYNEECREIITQQIIRRQGVTPLNDVVTCLMDAYAIMSKAENYHDAVMMAVKMGNQSTALASAVGGIAGIQFGYQDIPTGWLNLLREQDTVENLIKKYDMECVDK